MAKGMVALNPGTKVLILVLSKMTLSPLSANNVPVNEGSTLQIKSEAMCTIFASRPRLSASIL